jgi:hypothetical protein
MVWVLIAATRPTLVGTALAGSAETPRERLLQREVPEWDRVEILALPALVHMRLLMPRSGCRPTPSVSPR